MKCRHCGDTVTLRFVDLGSAPLSNALLTPASLHGPEKWYPLRVQTCARCWLVQTEDYAHQSELFSNDYAYFSSFSTSWVRHAEEYVAMVVPHVGLGAESLVVEVACNDGYLLQFVAAREIPCVGIEPTASTASAARSKGLEVIEGFFGVALADRLANAGHSADLMIANNVLAHVPDVNDFISGFTHMLKPSGVATFEFPHLLRMVAEVQFDTIYHEHFSYLSLTAVLAMFERNGLSVYDVESLPTHGGSLRVFAQRTDSGRRQTTPRVEALKATERDAGVMTSTFYEGFQEKADNLKNAFLEFLIATKRAGKSVAAYGAAAKGNTLLNYTGVRRDLIRFVVDRNPAKQGRFMPGSRIAIVDEECLRSAKPDFVVVLPWNLKVEITEQIGYVTGWGGQFVTAIPQLQVFS